MTIETKELVRSFRYNSVDLIDPGVQYTPAEVRDLYAPTYPEILNAAIEGPEEKDGKLVYTFRRAVGTKGTDKITVKLGVGLIGMERLRQINDLGWDAAHDDEHEDGSLALAACAYASPQPLYRVSLAGQVGYSFVDCWPRSWADEYDKRQRGPDGKLLLPLEAGHARRIRALTKAGALIAAEIDRLLRIQEKELAKT